MKHLIILNLNKIFISLILFFTQNILFSQVNTATPEDIESFYKSTTCIVKDDKPFSMLNAYIKEAVEKNWHITKYRFIDGADFQKLNQSPEYSFIILTEAEYTENKTKVKLDILNLVLGHKNKSLDDLPDLGSIPLVYADDEEDSYLYKIPAFIKLMQYQIALIKQQKINSPQALLDYHNKFNSEIKGKELWLLEEELSPEINSTVKLNKAGLLKVKITDKDALEVAIEEGKDILFAHIVKPYMADVDAGGRCWKFIISAKDGKIYFAENQKTSHVKESVLNSGDIKKFTR